MANTFSEGWFQIAPLKVALLPSAKVHKQVYRGMVWYVLQDACSGKFFRVREGAYQFIAALSIHKTVEEVWHSFIERYPEEAPGQEEVIHLLSQLHHSNLLFFRSAADHGAILERQQKQTRKEHLSKLMAFMYLRVPLWNPNDLLTHFARLLNPLMSRTALLVWLGVIFVGANAAIENWPKLSEQGQGFLSADNLILLYISMFILKFFHEMGHAIALKRFGGETHTIGLMFIVFTPLPYVDATATWAMRSRWQRVAVGAAGMYVELFFAAIAAIIWAQTAPGILNSLAFNMMVIGSISSLLFNGNPLLRFDAYYILSDLLDLPNLYQKSGAQWLYYFDKWLLGTPKPENPAENLYEQVWYTLYGFLSYFYRLLVMLFITIYAADIWIGLGVILILISLAIWVFIPLGKLLKYLSTSQKLRKNRTRAWWASLASLAALVGVLSLVPLPYSIKAPGVVQSVQSTQIFTQSGGKLIEALPETGQWVEVGTLLARFESQDLLQEQKMIQQQLVEIGWLTRQALQKSQSDVSALQKREQAILGQLTEVTERLNQMAVYAPFSGYWLPNQLQYKIGMSFKQAQDLGRMVNPIELRFVAVVPQEQASDLFDLTQTAAELRFSGQADTTLKLAQVFFNPFRKSLLPSPALGWEGGGTIMARRNAQGDVETVEPFFEVVAPLTLTQSADLQLQDGMTGWLKFDLAWQPFFWQARQKILQIMQQRYQV